MISAASRFAAVVLLPLVLSAQSVVSVHSGVVHYFEGAVAIDGLPLEQHFGRFEEIRPGSELRTDQGRAEVLLTPGVLLRVDQNSSIRMISNKLADTRVAFVGGSASVDSRNGSATPPITVSFQNYEVHFKAAGCYRFDSAPARVRIDAGEAEVSFMGQTVSATANHTIALAPALTAGPFVNNMDDGLDRWAQDRSMSVAADNASAATSDNLTADLDNPQTPYGGGAYGGGGYGGGYGLGVDPAFLSPSDLWFTNVGIYPWSPASFYPGLLFGYLYLPSYRRSPLFGYRPYLPIRGGPYLPPVHRGLVHATPTYVRRSVSTGISIHPVGRR
jgi:hypothetical protein